MNTMTQPLDSIENPFVALQGADLEDRESDPLDLEEFPGDIPTVVLPNKVIALEAAGRTDVGESRQHNEDFFVIDHRVTQIITPDDMSLYSRGLYILCDGMGGHAKGEVASRLAAETLVQYFSNHWKEEIPSEADLKDAIYCANQTLYTLNEEGQSLRGKGRMGTTLVLALLKDTQFRFAHVGDSRLYRLTHHHGFEQLTVDHEVGQRDIRRGVAPDLAYARHDAYQLTQALGPRSNDFLRPDTHSLTLKEDTVFLLCSDGMTDNDLLERHEETHLKPLLDFENSLEDGLKKLVDLANAENGHDNVTVVGIRAKLSFQRVPPLSVTTSD
jgi:protein phosphatase